LALAEAVGFFQSSGGFAVWCGGCDWPHARTR